MKKVVMVLMTVLMFASVSFGSTPSMNASQIFNTNVEISQIIFYEEFTTPATGYVIFKLSDGTLLSISQTEKTTLSLMLNCYNNQTSISYYGRIPGLDIGEFQTHRLHRIVTSPK